MKQVRISPSEDILHTSFPVGLHASTPHPLLYGSPLPHPKPIPLGGATYLQEEEGGVTHPQSSSSLNSPQLQLTRDRGARSAAVTFICRTCGQGWLSPHRQAYC